MFRMQLYGAASAGGLGLHDIGATFPTLAAASAAALALSAYKFYWGFATDFRVLNASGVVVKDAALGETGGANAFAMLERLTSSTRGRPGGG
jgi:hypothetical protein